MTVSIRGPTNVSPFEDIRNTPPEIDTQIKNKFQSTNHLKPNRKNMIFAILASVLAIPAVNLDILPIDENHPAVMHDYTPTESFASSGGVLRDIQQLESLAGQPFEKNWSKLPSQSKLKRNVWPGPYWPTSADGINKRWAGENSLSPVEKYAKAFGLDAKTLADTVSRKSGIDSQSGMKKCKSDDDCDEAACAIRRGETEGRCIPTWFGICHAWAPVSMLEEEPMKAITVNDVTFEPLDIKALITQMYDTARVGTIFTGQRCNVKNPPKDSDGRFVNEECRDISPEFFHLTLTNYIGRFEKSIIAELDADYQVWNHPVVGYEILQQVKRPLVGQEIISQDPILLFILSIPMPRNCCL
jgi:hypothetical protein